MADLSEFRLNDHRFLETITCPLKLPFLLDNSPLSERPPVFRQMNKLRLRDAIAMRFEGCKQTSDDTGRAARETEKWLLEPEIAICGALLEVDGLMTRIPILVKKQDHYTIIQVHGKLRKRSGRGLPDPEMSRTTAGMIIKAAYRFEILNRLLPDAKVDVHLYFPQKSFFSPVNNLNKLHKEGEDFAPLYQELFTRIDAGERVTTVRNRLPAIAVHPEFEGLSVGQAIDKIETIAQREIVGIKRHRGCGPCTFRKSRKGHTGCWEKNFTDKKIRRGELHVPELMGAGNSELLQNDVFYQEEVEVGDRIRDGEYLSQLGGPMITIQQRRLLQILRAKEKPSPLIWVKKDAQRLWSVRFPIHFIDFEAATYAIPLRRGDRPYTPLCFQFSCHTLREDGSLEHHEWLHSEPDSENLHSEFAERLLDIPDIFDGTIMHYSPFERQAIQRLMGEFQRDRSRFQREIGLLDTFLSGRGLQGSSRFIDLSEYIRRYYYNSYMGGSLSLKEVLESVLVLEQNVPFKIRSTAEAVQFIVRTEFIGELSPYQMVQNSEMAIMDGSSAMHAWIAQKNGAVENVVSEEINRLLRAYCELDSLAMVFLFRHLLRNISRDQETDTILY